MIVAATKETMVCDECKKEINREQKRVIVPCGQYEKGLDHHYHLTQCAEKALFKKNNYTETGDVLKHTTQYLNETMNHVGRWYEVITQLLYHPVDELTHVKYIETLFIEMEAVMADYFESTGG
jgi:hypothetical protein